MMVTKVQTEAEALRAQILDAQKKLMVLEQKERLADIEDIIEKIKRWKPTRKELRRCNEYMFDGSRQRRVHLPQDDVTE
jgi:hypothetical protein